MVEHAFGVYKGRFPALKSMPGRDIKRIYLAVEALMVLHNIFIEYGDNAEEIDDFDSGDEEAREIGEEMNPWAEEYDGPLREMYNQRHAQRSLETTTTLKEQGIAL